MRCLLLMIVVAVGAASERRAVLHYSFEPAVNDGKLALHTVLEFQGGATDAANLVLPSSWGSATHLEKGIANLKSVAQAGHVRVSYDLVKDWEVPPPRADHHAILEPEYFEFTTQNGLVHPLLERSAPVEVNFDWRKLPAGWSLATSFGTGERVQRFRGSWSEVHNALFAGGDLRIRRKNIDGRPLILAIRGKWQLSDEEMALRIEKLISFERRFWHDTNFPYYLVTVSTFGRDDGGSGGSGFTNAFALFLSRKSTLAYGEQSLLAHEIFHTWNPYRMGALPDSSIVTSWFTEGFTTYYQDLLLLRAGLLAFPDYVERTNEVLRKYLLSPAKNVSNQEIIERHRADAAMDDLPYARGAITALWLDWKIRETTHAKASLDTLLFELVRQARRERPALTAERIFRTAGKYIDPAAVQEFREYVEAGKTVPVPAAALGTCVTLRMEEIPRFELGMDRESLVAGRVVSQIKPDSAAFLAGLRDGQQVAGISVYWNDVSKPVKVTIRTESGNKSIEYYPLGDSIGTVPQYRLGNSRCVENTRGGVTTYPFQVQHLN